VPTEVNADARRKEVVARAAELFDAGGYHTTNMAAVARAVGLEKPTLYHYFSGKDEILYWIHEEFIDRLIAKADDRADAGLSAEEELRGMMRDVLELMQTHRGHVRVFFEHHRELTEDRQKTIRTKRDTYEEKVRTVVQRGMDDGEFRPTSARLVTLAIFGMCNWAYQWYRSGGGLDHREIAYRFWGYLVQGLGAPKA
jgi:AcrR family transcriptional regulator